MFENEAIEELDGVVDDLEVSKSRKSKRTEIYLSLKRNTWHKKGIYWGPNSCLQSSPVFFCIFEHQGVHLDKNGIYQTV